MKKDIEPRCVKLYLQDVCILREIPKAIQDTLYLILRKLDFDGYIYLTTTHRQKICDELNIVRRTLKDRITILKKAHILHKKTDGGRNEYVINPYIIARGTWSDVQRQRGKFEIRHTYDAKNGKTTSFHTYIGDKETSSATLEEVFSGKPTTQEELLQAKDKELAELREQIIKLKATQVAVNQEEINNQLTNNTNIKHLVTIEYYNNHLEAVDAFRQMCFDYDDKFFTLQQNIETFDNWCEMFKLDKQGNPRPYPTPKIKCNNYFKRCLETHNNSIQNEVQTNKDLMNADLLGDFL